MSELPDKSSSPPPNLVGAVATVQKEVSRLLDAASGGDPRASGQLLPLVYDDLRRVAAAMLAKEPVLGANTLQPTALVHEAYLRLVGSSEGEGAREVSWENRRHFFGAAARAMRRIIIDRARHIRATRLERGADLMPEAERGSGPGTGAAQEPASGDLPAGPEELLALDLALQELAARDARQHEVVMLRYFAGLTIEQTAQALGVSPGTVKGDWNYARAWLLRRIEASSPPPLGRAL